MATIRSPQSKNCTSEGWKKDHDDAELVYDQNANYEPCRYDEREDRPRDDEAASHMTHHLPVEPIPLRTAVGTRGSPDTVKRV